MRLSDTDLDIVHRVMSHKVPDGSYDMYAPWIDHFTHEVMEMPLSGRPESKKSFIPSKVNVLLYAVCCCIVTYVSSGINWLGMYQQICFAFSKCKRAKLSDYNLNINSYYMRNDQH